MTPTRPYLVRAFYDWINDNECTPYIVVNAMYEGALIPQEYVEGGQIVLNISISAVQAFNMNNEGIEFSARFGGVARSIYVPMMSIMAIYARENGRGMVFSEEDGETPPPAESKGSGGESQGKSGKKEGGGRPHLTVVK